MKPYTRALILTVAACVAPFALPATAAETKPDPREELASKIPGAKVQDLRPSPIDGVYELARGADFAYVSKDGRYAIAGDLYDLSSNNNLTENRRREFRLKQLATVPESQMLIFGPRDAKHTVTVFTDVDCGYCRKLHSQMAEYNRLGIRVRYLFYPRSGPDTESWAKADEVWCSPNRNDALTRAKRGEALKAKPCSSSPVEHHFELAQELDLRGTPAIITSDGGMLPGYVPPAVLMEHLQTARR